MKLFEKSIVSSLKKGNKYFLIFSLVFLLAAIYFYARYWSFTPNNFGYSLVSVEVPYKDAFFYATPMTYIIFFLFLSFAFGLQFLQEFLRNLNTNIIVVLLIFSFLCALINFHEIIWEALYWTVKATMINATTDIEVNSITFLPGGHLGNTYAANVFYVNRLSLLYFIVSAYSIFYFHRIMISKKF